MICDKCQLDFRFKDVPFDRRITKALYAEFYCPGCGVKLKPGALQVALMAIAVMLLLLAITTALWDWLPGNVGAALGLGGFALFVVSSFCRTTRRA